MWRVIGQAGASDEDRATTIAGIANMLHIDREARKASNVRADDDRAPRFSIPVFAKGNCAAVLQGFEGT